MISLTLFRFGRWHVEYLFLLHQLYTCPQTAQSTTGGSGSQRTLSLLKNLGVRSVPAEVP
jgi:hypothetical protein